ncbi:MAG: hypothetical protein MUW56_02590 [Chryseobacterium sp.]|uniref:hypothetical protein n=1 Tax=Chryseobacterium sp. TaxID=1871047 RepID=UPI0025BA70D2|nr:hypothetical protein [Chryseobacterium sp.]MCJ7932535.1 hypothetical protein [Chryseobacterium sp.]
MRNQSIIALFALAGTFFSAQQKNEFVAPNENLITENILPIPKNLGQSLKKIFGKPKCIFGGYPP